MSTLIASNIATPSGYLSLYNGSYTAISQSFAFQFNATLSSMKFRLFKSGTPTGNVYAKLYAHTGTYGTDSEITGSVLATSDPVVANSLGDDLGNADWVEFTFSTGYELSENTYYVCVIEYSDASSNSSNKISVQNKVGHDGNYATYDGSWTTYSNGDALFQVYGTDLSYTPLTSKHLGFYSGFALGQNYWAGSLKGLWDYDEELDDSVSLSDVSSSKTFKGLFEGIVLSDAISKVLESIKSFTDSIVLNDTLASAVSYFKELVESIVANDTISSIVDYVRELVDSVSISEAFTQSIVFVQNLVDSIVASDIISTVKGYIKTFVDSVIANDTISDALTYVRSLADSISLTDTFSKIQIFIKDLADSVDIADTIEKLSDKVFGEIISLVDSKVLMPIKGLVDSISLTDVFTKVQTFIRSLIDSISVIDTVKNLTGKVFSEAVSLIDSMVQKFVYIRNLVDSIVLEDTFSKLSDYVRGLVDNIVQSDVIQKFLSFGSFVDGIGLSDVYSKITEKVLESVVVITDVFSRIADYVRSFVDNFSILDIIDTISGTILHFVDTIIARDSILRIVARYLVDTAQMIDRLGRGFFVSLAEALHITDETFDIDKFIHLLLEDVVSLSESIRKHANILVSSIISIVDSRFVKKLNGQLIEWSKKVRSVIDWVKESKDRDSYIKIEKARDDWELEKKDLGLYESNVKPLDEWTKLRKEE